MLVRVPTIRLRLIDNRLHYKAHDFSYISNPVARFNGYWNCDWSHTLSERPEHVLDQAGFPRTRHTHDCQTLAPAEAVPKTFLQRTAGEFAVCHVVEAEVVA